MADNETFSEKVMKEMGFNLNMSDRKPIAFFAFWIDRRDDGTPTATICNMKDEELTDDLQTRTVQCLRDLADSIERG